MDGVDKLSFVVAGRTLLETCVEVFEASALIDQIVLVARPDRVDDLRHTAIACRWAKVRAVVAGGVRRQDSVIAGLGTLQGCDWVMVHDAARPCVTGDILQRGIEAAEQTGAALAAVPVKDTVKMAGPNEFVEATPERSRLWLAQTPQVFATDILCGAYAAATGDFTDDAAAVEATGRKVKLFLGAYSNIKVTTPDDLVVAEAFLRGQAR
jgi:2-C-methyl-D-erythritol 4-phosphate cytidylyltransferase